MTGEIDHSGREVQGCSHEDDIEYPRETSKEIGGEHMSHDREEEEDMGDNKKFRPASWPLF